MYSSDSDASTNLNIRISKNLKDFSSSLLQVMGVNQSQYIRDALQYVVDHNSLPWHRNTTNSLLYKYTTQQSYLYNFINHISQMAAIDHQQISFLCNFLDDLHLHSAMLQDTYTAQGLISFQLSKLSGLLIQLTNLLRYNTCGMVGGVVYPPIVINQIRHLTEQIDIVIKNNSL